MTTNAAPPPPPRRNQPAPAPVAARARSFVLWAFLISAVGHFIVGPLLIHFKPPKADQQKEQVVTVAKKTKVVVPTPPPPTPTPPPPTPPPKQTPPPVKQTNPPPVAKLKVHPPKQQSESKQANTTEQTYSAPKQGSEEGNPNGTVASAPPAPVSTAPVATPAPTPVPTPSPTPKPQCANPNADASMTNKAELDYPEMAREQNITGTALVKVTLSATGGVVSATIYKSANNASLDAEAIRAAKASSYSPEISACEKVGGSYIFQAEFDTQ